MRLKALLSLALFTGTTTAFAQDVIVKHDGSTILSKVTEIGVTEVKYKKFSNQNGPTYSILKSDILSINYENGEKETFANSPKATVQEGVKQKVITATPAADNVEIISRYNRDYEHGTAIKNKDKKAEKGLCILGVGENSVLSTEDVTVEFRQEPTEENVLRMRTFGLYVNFFVQIYNKTDQIVYIDLGSTFRIMKDGSSKVYYDNSQTTINKGNGSGASINLGAIAGATGIGGAVGTLANGVNVGGVSNSSVSKVYAKQQIIAIPPHGKMPLEKDQREWISNSKSEVVFEGERFYCKAKKEEMPKRGEKIFYNESDSPYHADYVITYSKDSEFVMSYIVKASVYARELIGTGRYETGEPVTRNKQELFNDMKKKIPEYNDYTIVGQCN
ncbi:MAG: hypothetical protein IJV34_00270 [Prevotella sp.]|nr:hypothetical protein [Prevotella sp.]